MSSSCRAGRPPMSIEPGAALPMLRLEILPERMKTMAALLQDPNPIHIDPEVVRGLGMGDRVINQGPSYMGYLMNLLLGLAPAAQFERLNVRFTANVFAGDVVLGGGEVESVDDEGRLHCTVWLDVE